MHQRDTLTLSLIPLLASLRLFSMTSALTNRPVVDKVGKRMFVSSAGTSFNCLNAETGRILWSKPKGNSNSVYTTEAKLDPNDDRVYSIQVSIAM